LNSRTARIRIHPHRNAFVLAIENIVIVGMRLAGRYRHWGRGVCAVLGLGLMRRRWNRLKQRLQAWSQMERRGWRRGRTPAKECFHHVVHLV
jgi:hypothetical protein